MYTVVHAIVYIFTDHTLHSAFKKDGGVEKILEHIQLGILRDGESNTVSLQTLIYMFACVK